MITLFYPVTNLLTPSWLSVSYVDCFILSWPHFCLSHFSVPIISYTSEHTVYKMCLAELLDFTCKEVNMN